MAGGSTGRIAIFLAVHLGANVSGIRPASSAFSVLDSPHGEPSCFVFRDGAFVYGPGHHRQPWGKQHTTAIGRYSGAGNLADAGHRRWCARIGQVVVEPEALG